MDKKKIKVQQREKTVRLPIKVNLTDGKSAPKLQAYAFTAQGKYLDSAVVEKKQHRP